MCYDRRTVLCGDLTNPGGVGRKSNGEPCRNPTVPGMFRCYIHGGASPLAKIKAENSMALLRMPAVEALHKVLEVLNQTLDQLIDNVCLTCGYPRGETDEKEALVRACRTLAQTSSAILDRTGLGPRATLEIKQSDGDLDLTTMLPEERQELMMHLVAIKQLKARMRERLHGLAFGLPEVAAHVTATTIQ